MNGMKRILYSFFLPLLFVSTALAHPHTTIRGRVLSGPGSHPVAGADVILQPLGSIAVSDAGGGFTFGNVSTGEFALSVSAPGYRSYSQLLKLEAGEVYVEVRMDTSVVELKEVTVESKKENKFGRTYLKSVEGAAIYAGKKTEVIELEYMSANLSTNNSRQIFSKVSGLNIWESDGAGLQLGIGGRGLSPNRSSNFNTRQNGYDISADALGYPESYYTPATEGVERIEVVRGAASLQYGTQFGGMVNFRMKKGNPSRRAELVARLTGGSFGFINSFTSLGGKYKRLQYYSFYQYKTGNGWRPNSGFDAHNAFVSLQYDISPNTRVGLDYTFMSYLAQQPGGLTDRMFEQDPRQSVRSRNWFRVGWNLPSLRLEHSFSNRLLLDSRFFGLIASREALGVLSFINRADPGTGRDLLSDRYRNYGNETRLMYRYSLLSYPSTLLVGTRFYRGLTLRRQGFANASQGPDFRYLDESNPGQSDYRFPSRNVSAFAENVFNINEHFSITPGLRYENIFTSSEGYYQEDYRDRANNPLPSRRVDDSRASSRALVLAGLGLSYKWKGLETYANVSQNYRSINFNDMRVANPNLEVDPQLKDEKGYSADLGFRGNAKEFLHFDLSLFLLNYRDRIGTVLLTDEKTFSLYRFRTNISDSRNVGLESFVELDVLRLVKPSSKTQLSLFSNLSWVDARYVNSGEAAFRNKRVENVPEWVFRGGITLGMKSLRLNLLSSYVSRQYTDATNAELTSNAVNGLIPAYTVSDLTLDYTWRIYTLTVAVNNLTDNRYFTRRAEGYPGPGIIPADARGVYVTLQVKL
jgi:Fe(3+) dicitrate transport protein